MSINANIDKPTTEGFNAYKDGFGQMKNPYHLYTEDATRWLRGWSQAALGSKFTEAV